MSIQPLTASQLRRVCDPASFPFDTTAALKPNGNIIGQPRGTRAIEFGIAMQSPGYNIYILGSTGTGRTTYISRFLKEKSRTQATPDDWVYVQNFAIQHQPRAIEFPAGEGALFKKRMEELVQCLKEDLPRAFSTEEYEEAVNTLWDKVELTQSLLMRDIERKARERGFALVRSASGLTVTPVVDGEVMSAEQYDVLSMEQQNKLDQNQEFLEGMLEDLVKKTRLIRQNARDELKALDRAVAVQAIAPHTDAMGEAYAKHEEVLLYLGEVQEDVLNHLDGFRPSTEEGEQKKQDLQRYDVNMFVDHSNTEGAPVIVAQNPTYNNLIGRIEFEMRGGIMSTKFTHIKPGSLHLANGGYLVIDATELISQPDSWEALKRALKTGEIFLQPYNTLDGSRVLAKSLDPEAIPLDIKIVLLGSSALYYTLVEVDDDFSSLFKVMADFGTTMTRNEENELAYAGFIAQLCADEKLLHFDRAAVARVIEYGSELAEEQDKLSTRFSTIADLVRESSFWATHHGRTLVSLHDVEHAINEWVYRSNKVETLIDEQIESDSLLIVTTGETVGQINGLSVLEAGEYAFGRPMRITARTYMGSNGIVQIERETSMADSVHNKGVMTITGYLGGMYAHEHALSLSASLTFEQLYGEIAGDSASSTELYALISSLSNLPIKQGIAVTGSVDQRGTIQPIGGVNEKIEGFFRVCEQRGLTGEQGVIIPQSNAAELMLDKDVIAAVEAGQFSVWAINHIDQGLEILLGRPAGQRDENGDFPTDSIHALAEDELLRLAKKESGEDENEDEDNEESDPLPVANDE